MKLLKRLISTILCVSLLAMTSISVEAKTLECQENNMTVKNKKESLSGMIAYYESLGDYESVEKLVTMYLNELDTIHAEDDCYVERSDPASIVAAIIAVCGAGYGGGYAVGQYAANHNWNYWTGQATLYLVVGGVAPNVLNAIVALGYDNGWHSVK